MTCYDSVTVDFERADEKRFVAGDYTLEMTVDGATTSATCTVPAAVTAQLTCYSDHSTQIFTDGAHVYVTFMAKPESVTVRLAVAKSPLAETTFTPAYEHRDECDTCFHAKKPVTVKP